MGSQRTGHHWATFTFTFIHFWEWKPYRPWIMYSPAKLLSLKFLKTVFLKCFPSNLLWLSKYPMTCLKKKVKPQNHRKVWSRHDIFLSSKYFSLCFFNTNCKDSHILECNYQTKILTLRQCYFLTYRSYSNFVSDFNNVLYSEKKSQDFVLHSIVSGYFQKHDLRNFIFFYCFLMILFLY